VSYTILSGKFSALKVTQLLSDYLGLHHRLALSGFGVITYDGSIQYAKEGESEKLVFAAGSLNFHPDPKAVVEEGLIAFISKETGKMKPLALSDVESYLEFGHELINISKPFHIEGLGTLQKNAGNVLVFIQDEFGKGNPAGLPKSTSRQKSRESDPGDSLYPGNQTAAADKKRALTQKLLIGLVIGLGLAVTYLLFSRYQQKSTDETGSAVMKKPEVTAPAANTIVNETTPAPVVTEKPATGVFNVVLEISGRERALKRYADLKEWGHNIQMVTLDSVSFKLFIPINAPLDDTARHRDSLRQFFNRRVWIEKTP
jgi:hypothetical protein